ncbi:ankyrin repeat-containing domain protein [Aspergillus heterothallicus]
MRFRSGAMAADLQTLLDSNQGPHLSSLNSVQALLKAGSDINAVNFWGQTPLLYASMYGNPQATRLLLAADADTSIMDKTGRTAMCYAVELGHMDIILQLLEHERKTPETDSTIKDAAFVRAAINGHGDMVKSLRRGMSSTPTDTTAFLTAAATAMVKDTMIPPLPQGSGPPWTSLHEEFLQKMLIWAAKEGCTETVEALLSRPDVDPNKPGTTDSRTPLECAVEGRHETIVDLLLRRNV